MRAKDIKEKLGVSAERIKFFRRKDIFTPENPSSGNKITDYTELDVERLRCIVVLTKFGLTCSDIKKMQDGQLTLEDAIKTRKRIIDEEIFRKTKSSSLLSELLDEKEEFETFDTSRFWNIIADREKAGEKFADPYGWYTICPNCGEKMRCNEEKGIFECPSCDRTCEMDDFEDILAEADFVKLEEL